MKMNPPFDLVIGLDRSDRKADLHWIDLPTGAEQRQTVPTSPEALQAWAEALRRNHPDDRVAVCFEQPANNLIAFLARYPWIVLYPINPISLQKFRETFVVSRAKDDGKDAEYLAHLLAAHHDRFQPWQPDTQQTRLLERLVVDRRSVVDHRTGLSNRLQAILKDYFPQALELAGDELWRPLATAFLQRWPTLQAVQHARPEAIRKFYYAQGSRSEKLIQERLDRIAHAVPLTDDPALLESYAMRVRLTVQELELVTRTIKLYDQKIAAVFAEHPDHYLFRNLPGAGPVFGPRLLTSLGTRREEYPKATNLQRASGIAPVTKQSGKSKQVHRRYRCSVFFKQSIHEWAAETRFWSDWARAFYELKRAAGMNHHTAVRALAYKWLRVVWRCWQDRVVYEEAKYLAALKKHGSPVIDWLNKTRLQASPA
jgi:transposase